MTTPFPSRFSIAETKLKRPVYASRSHERHTPRKNGGQWQRRRNRGDGGHRERYRWHLVASLGTFQIMTGWITGSRRERRAFFSSRSIPPPPLFERIKTRSGNGMPEDSESEQREREGVRDGERSTKVQEETKMKVTGHILAIASFHSEVLFTLLLGKQTRRKTRLSEKHCVFECVGQKSRDCNVYVAIPFATPFIQQTRRPTRMVLATPVQSVASIFVSSIFVRRVSLFEHLFPASGRATRMPCNENAVRIYRLRQHRIAERGYHRCRKKLINEHRVIH